MYSPVDRPLRIRAAPAKKRIWSTIGGSSSSMVSWKGLPVFSTSSRTSSSPRSSSASASLARARLRSAGVASRQRSKPRAAAWQAASTSAAPDSGTSAKPSPLDGLTRVEVRPSAASACSPSMKFCSLRMSPSCASRSVPALSAPLAAGEQGVGDGEGHAAQEDQRTHHFHLGRDADTGGAVHPQGKGDRLAVVEAGDDVVVDRQREG